MPSLWVTCRNTCCDKLRSFPHLSKSLDFSFSQQLQGPTPALSKLLTVCLANSLTPSQPDG